MSTEENYNGWLNYETWLVALWLDNDKGSQGYWREATQEAWDMAEDSGPMKEWNLSRHHTARHMLAERLKDELEEGNPVQTADLYGDLMNAALAGVDWLEIADHYLVDRVGDSQEASDS